MDDSLSHILLSKLCYLCSSDNVILSSERRPVIFYRLHHYYKCLDCRAFSLFPKLEIGEVEDLYSTSYVVNANFTFHMPDRITENRFSKLQKTLILHENRGEKMFLDYGCGAGAEAVIFASRLGYKAFGVEVENGTRKEAQIRSGCKIFSPLEVLSSGSCFDIIFLGDVLEHISDPSLVLKQVRDLLSPNGVVIIQGPLEGAFTISNLLISAKAKLLSSLPANFPPYHVSLATRESIKKALKNNGLTLQDLIITEPFWPAPRFLTRASFSSMSAFILSFAKILDIGINKLFKNYGTRFFLRATK